MKTLNTLSIALRLSGALLAFITTIVLAATVSPEQFGTYAFAVAAATVFGVLGYGGLPILTVREAASTASLSRQREIWTWTLKGLLVGSTIAVIGYGWTILVRIRSADTASLIIVGGLLILANGLLASSGAMLRGMNKVLSAQLLEAFVRHGILLVIVLGFGASLGLAWLTARHLLALSGTALAFVAVIALALLARSFRGAPSTEASTTIDGGKLSKAAVILSIGATLSALQSSADLIAMGLLGSLSDVGVYRVLVSAASVVQLGLSALVFVYAPSFARTHALGDGMKLRAESRDYAYWSTATSIIFFILAAAFARPVFEAVLPPAYATAVPILLVLLAGPVLSSVFGAGYTLLNMVGEETSSALCAAVGAAVNVGLSVALIPSLGMWGAAIASTASVVAWRGMAWLIVVRRLGLDTSLFAVRPGGIVDALHIQHRSPRTLPHQGRIGPFEVQALRSVEAAAEAIVTLRGRVVVALNAEKLAANVRLQPHLARLGPRAWYYPDGIAVVGLMWSRGLRTARIPGIELWEQLMAMAARRSMRVFLLGAAPDVALATANRLRNEMGVRHLTFRDGYFEQQGVAPETLLKEVISLRPDIICVALGSPRQEQLMADFVEAYPHALYMGVGGSLDVYSGHKRRAPAVFRRLGLEWLYRATSEPRRLWRYRSLLVFIWYALLRKY